MIIKVKRAYEPAKSEDGYRILIDRLWPRGIAKSDLKTDMWLKAIAPSQELRKWFNHEPNKWHDFKKRYFLELRENKESITTIAQLEYPTITFVYAAKEERYNNAVALKMFFDNYHE